MPKGVYSIEGRRKVWTDRDRFEVEDGIANGLTYAQIARRLGRSENSVKVYCARNVICAPLRPWSARTVAALLGLGCSKIVTRWADMGWISARKGAMGAGKHRRWAFTEDALHAFMENPDHWHRWAPERITDPDLREWAIEVRRERYLTHAQVAARYFVVVGTVGAWVDRGLLPSARNGNRLIPESALRDFVPPSQREHSGYHARRFTPDEDRLLVRLRWAEGLSWPEIARRMGRSMGSVYGRYMRVGPADEGVAA